MATIHSRCCEFDVPLLPVVPEGYCYVCGEVHRHDHLDLRPLNTTLLCKVTARHPLNWPELMKDTKKVDGMREGEFCQSLLTELEALCPHGEPVYYKEQPLRLHMCYGYASRTKGTGLDFTTDLCDRDRKCSHLVPEEVAAIAYEADRAGEGFEVGDILKYNPSDVSFSRIDLS